MVRTLPCELRHLRGPTAHRKWCLVACGVSLYIYIYITDLVLLIDKGLCTDKAI